MCVFLYNVKMSSFLQSQCVIRTKVDLWDVVEVPFFAVQQEDWCHSEFRRTQIQVFWKQNWRVLSKFYKAWKSPKFIQLTTDKILLNNLTGKVLISCESWGKCQHRFIRGDTAVFLPNANIYSHLHRRLCQWDQRRTSIFLAWGLFSTAIK